jgi:hypothetical protein
LGVGGFFPPINSISFCLGGLLLWGRVANWAYVDLCGFRRLAQVNKRFSVKADGVMNLRLMSAHVLTALRGLPRWFGLVPLFVWVAWAFWPVMAGDFVADDYVFVATGRMVDAPWAAFWQSHFFEPYYFRPIGVLSWWLATRLFGLDYGLHSLINLVLHCVNVALLYGLLRGFALRVSAIYAGAALFALGPFAMATILWPSNRFDLIAVGFLLLQAIAMRRALVGGAAWVVVATLAALGACWGKELAYPVATVLACLALAARGVAWRRRLLVFALTGLAVSLAFLVRHVVLVDAYALTATDPLLRVLRGSVAMLGKLPALTSLAVGEVAAVGFGAVILGVFAVALVALTGVARGDRRLGLLMGVGAVGAAAFVVQTPLAAAFAPMLDGAVFGTVTFARFYYAPWAVGCVLMALLVSTPSGVSVVWGRCAGAVLLVAAIIVGGSSRSLSVAFARWTASDVRPMALAATAVVESAARSQSAGPCVVVLLDTELKHPYFRMFSDVTVKARTGVPDAVWRCYVMSERTPWLFAFPAVATLADLPLLAVPDFGGQSKADSFWGGVRYRYRLPAADVLTLPGAHFLLWREGVFLDVTAEVRRGERKVLTRDW